MSKISIGDNNKIVKSNIGDHNEPASQSFIEKFILPIITGAIAGIIAGIILMFKFWPSFITAIENFFK